MLYLGEQDEQLVLTVTGHQVMTLLFGKVLLHYINLYAGAKLSRRISKLRILMVYYSTFQLTMGIKQS